jgi:hypothetical protein
MSREKRFDCVNLKNTIQAQLLKAHEGLSDAEVRAQLRRRLESSDSLVARLWRTLQVRMTVSK